MISMLKEGKEKNIHFVVCIQRDGKLDKPEYVGVFATTAQDAVDKVRFETNCYGVLECFKAVKNWT